jgi:hypothetical protein
MADSKQKGNPVDRFRTLLLRQEVVIGNLSREDLWLIMVVAAQSIPSGEALSEKGVTERLAQWLSTVGCNIRMDAVELRRSLIDCRCLERDPAGREYRCPQVWPVHLSETVSALKDMEIESFAQQVRTEEVEHRAARKKAALEKGGESRG